MLLFQLNLQTSVAPPPAVVPPRRRGGIEYKKYPTPKKTESDLFYEALGKPYVAPTTTRASSPTVLPKPSVDTTELAKHLASSSIIKFPSISLTPSAQAEEEGIPDEILLLAFF